MKPEEAIAFYYKAVDASTFVDEKGEFGVNQEKVREIAAMFAPKAAYGRNRNGEEELFRGDRRIEHFFLHERALIGKHYFNMPDGRNVEINSCNLLNERFTLRVTGYFEGEFYPNRDMKSPKHVKLPFADKWVFDEQGKIRYRRSDITCPKTISIHPPLPQDKTRSLP